MKAQKITNDTISLALQAGTLIVCMIIVLLLLQLKRTSASLETANNLLEAGDFQSARELYKKLIEKEPYNFSAHYGLGMSWCGETIYKDELGLAKAEDWYPAIYHMTVAMNMKENKQVQETLAILHFNLGIRYKKENDYSNAIKIIKQAVHYNPKLLKALNVLGAMYHEQKDYTNAQYYYEQAVIVQPDYAMAHFNLGALAWAQEKYTRATEYFQQAALVNPQSSYFSNWLKKAKEKAGEQ